MVDDTKCPWCGGDGWVCYPGWRCGSIKDNQAYPCRVSQLEAQVERLATELKVHGVAADIIRKVIHRLKGYEDGRYGEQGDFNPDPVYKSILDLETIIFS